MTLRYSQHGGIINNVSHIEIVVVLRYHQQRVSLVVVVIAVFHSEIIDGVYIKGQFVKTAVAKERQHTRQMKPEFIAFGTVIHIKSHPDIGIAHVFVFHILEKLFA